MSDLAIKVDSLSKLYHIGGPQAKYKTIRESIVDGAKAPFRRAGRLIRGQSYGASDLDQTIWALKDVSFEVKQGEVVGIIGRNGAGKSTLLKILSRITEPTEGEVMLRGRVGSLLEVGTGFHPELTGRENVYLNGAILGMRREEIDRKFDEIVDFSGIEQFIDTPVKHYSSGMYVRLAFSVAAHLETEILLVDEVLAVGDASFQKKCIGKMGQVAQTGRTVLFVSHNMAAVVNLCSKAFLIINGNKQCQGKPDDVVETYIQSLRFPDVVPLVNSTNRSGSGKLIFTDISLLNSAKQLVSNLVSGQSAWIILDYKTSLPLSHVKVSIGIYDMLGRFLLMFDNEMTGQPFEVLSLEGRFNCHIPRFPLTAGSYRINIHCEIKGVVSDWIRDAYVINVVDGDFYGSGKNPPKSHGGFLADHSWSMGSA